MYIMSRHSEKLTLSSKVQGLTIVPHECEIWFLTLREEQRLRVFENRVLKRMFWPKREEVTGGWGQILNENVRNVCTLLPVRMIKSRKMWWESHIAYMREMRNVCKVYLQTYIYRRQDSIKIVLWGKSWRLCIWFNWFRNGTTDGLLWTQQ
jgi:hypothetical protein